ncbi:MAG: YolD-like family protein [Ruminococcaceae bacterium]|nr:YolD-like family protein [Oscillospiraceae bacterium]
MTSSQSGPDRYEDIIHLPHHVSLTHAHMPLLDRAAQFAPFKALTGYEDDMEETARLTDERVVLDETRIAQLDERLRLLSEHLAEAPAVSITYFRPDRCKEGGSYETVTGAVKKLDPVQQVILLRDGRQIPIEDVFDISGELFASEGTAENSG